jgi:hypothetical protein
MGVKRFINRNNFSLQFQQSILYSEEAAVFVVLVDLVQFIHKNDNEIKFDVAYEVKGSHTNAKLKINVGHFIVNSKSIYGLELDVINWEFEKYKNLLAITSVSHFASFDISFKTLVHDNKIEDFFVKKLKFLILRTKKDQEYMQVLLSVI